MHSKNIMLLCPEQTLVDLIEVWIYLKTFHKYKIYNSPIYIAVMLITET